MGVTRFTYTNQGLVGVLAAVALTVLGFAVPTIALGQAKIAVGAGADPAFAPLFIAQEKGFWKKRGVDVDMKLFPSGGAALTSIISGDVVAALGGAAPCLLAAGRSSKVVLAAGSADSDKYYGLVARKPIASAQDLKGKKVAALLGTNSEFFIEEYLKQNKMSRQDVDLVNLEAPEMLAALNGGDVDAYAAYGPWLARATQVLGDKVRVIGGSNGFFYNPLWLCVDRDFAQTENAQRFMQGLLDADTFIKADPDAAAEIVAGSLRMPEAEVKGLMALQTFDVVLSDHTLKGLVETEAWLVSKGKLKPIDNKLFVYPDLLRKVKPNAVSYRTLPP